MWNSPVRLHKPRARPCYWETQIPAEGREGGREVGGFRSVGRPSLSSAFAGQTSAHLAAWPCGRLRRMTVPRGPPGSPRAPRAYQPGFPMNGSQDSGQHPRKRSSPGPALGTRQPGHWVRLVHGPFPSPLRPDGLLIQVLTSEQKPRAYYPLYYPIPQEGPGQHQ